MRRWFPAALALVLAVLACGAPRAGTLPVAAQGTGAAAQNLVPPGLGTLKFDEITIALRNGPLLIKVTPMDESIIRLLAPDTYDRYHSLVTNRHAEAAAAVAPTRTPQLMFVTFFSYEADVEYQPEDLQLSNQGRQMRAVKILPITSGFGRQRLAQQSQQAALYVFDEDIDYNQSLVVRYGTTDADAWARIIPKLEVERAKVRAKAGSGSL